MKPKTVVVALCLLLILLPDARGGTEALPQEVTGGRSFTVDRPAYLAAVSREGTFTMTVDDSTGTVPVGLNTVGVVVRFLEHTGNITVTFPSPGAFLVAESVILDCVFVKEHVTDLTSPAAFIVMPDRSLADRGFDGCRIRVAGDVRVTILDHQLHPAALGPGDVATDAVYVVVLEPTGSSANITLFAEASKAGPSLLIIGVAGFALILVIAVLVVVVLWKRKRRKRETASSRTHLE